MPNDPEEKNFATLEKPTISNICCLHTLIDVWRSWIVGAAVVGAIVIVVGSNGCSGGSDPQESACKKNVNQIIEGCAAERDRCIELDMSESSCDLVEIGCQVDSIKKWDPKFIGCTVEEPPSTTLDQCASQCLVDRAYCFATKAKSCMAKRTECDLACPK